MYSRKGNNSVLFVLVIVCPMVHIQCPAFVCTDLLFLHSILILKCLLWAGTSSQNFKGKMLDTGNSVTECLLKVSSFLDDLDANSFGKNRAGN